MELKIEVGKSYLNGWGVKVQISKPFYYNHGSKYKYQNYSGLRSYDINGNCHTHIKKDHLVEEVEENIDYQERINDRFNDENSEDYDSDWSVTDKPSSVFKTENEREELLSPKSSFYANCFPEATVEMISTKADKHDSGKTMLAFIPTTAILELGKVFTHGANKYGAFNYTKGHKATQLISAALRHIVGEENNPGYLMGNNTDKDSGLLHLAHAMANLAMLIQQHKDGTIDDDRPVIEDK